LKKDEENFYFVFLIYDLIYLLIRVQYPVLVRASIHVFSRDTPGA